MTTSAAEPLTTESYNKLMAIRQDQNELIQNITEHYYDGQRRNPKYCLSRLGYTGTTGENCRAKKHIHAKQTI